MLVGERMAHPVVAIAPDTSVHDALHLMRSEHIRRVPVVQNGHLVGIVSMKDLLNASPSAATTLSVWELNYLLSKLTVSQVMNKHVVTITEDTPIEEAARLMADKRIGGLPVVRGDHVVGMITETDLFKLFLELMGARTNGVRVAVQMQDAPGQLAKLTGAVAAAGGNIIALGTFTGDETGNSEVMIKIAGLSIEQTREAIAGSVEKILDIRVANV